jgi:hypothetical protein
MEEWAMADCPIEKRQRAIGQAQAVGISRSPHARTGILPFWLYQASMRI